MAAWTPEESVRLKGLHSQRRSLHSIAGEMGRSKETVKRHADRLNLSFDRTRTAKAAEAVHVDNKMRRAILEERLLEVAAESLDLLNQSSLVYSFGGQDNRYAEEWQDRPDPVARKHHIQAANTAITSANKLHELNSSTAADHSRSMLMQMQSALIDAVRDDGSAG